MTRGNGDEAWWHGDVTRRNGDEAPRNGDEAPRNGDVTRRNGDEAPRNGDVTRRNGDEAPRNGNGTLSPGDEARRNGNGARRSGDEARRKENGTPRDGDSARWNEPKLLQAGSLEVAEERQTHPFSEASLLSRCLIPRRPSRKKSCHLLLRTQKATARKPAPFLVPRRVAVAPQIKAVTAPQSQLALSAAAGRPPVTRGGSSSPRR